MVLSSHTEKPTMADENTPLIAVVPTRPHRDRYPHHRLRYICTLLLSLTLFIGLITVLFVLNFAPLDSDTETSLFSLSTLALPFRKHNIPDSWPYSAGISYEELVEILQLTPDREKAREWSRYYASGPHLAGKNLSQALWTRERWEEFGIQAEIVDYDTYINYPLGHRLALLERKSNSSETEEGVINGEEDWSVKYEASLEEDILDEDPTSGLDNRVPTFHGYSASGNVTAQYVYVNYGTFQDFEDLLAKNVSLGGKIALVKYGRIFRGLKVKRAQELGMLGVVMYSDPGDDGEVTEENGIATYPDGPARNPSSVQRGSCQFLSTFEALRTDEEPEPLLIDTQALHLEILRHQAIRPNQVFLVNPSTMLFLRSRPSPYHTRMLFPSSKRSMDMAPKPNP
jgi:N-acetylated-alpha-linked acidic dipeptidase